jgi:hypothetical protein
MLRIYCLQQWYNLSDPGAGAKVEHVFRVVKCQFGIRGCDDLGWLHSPAKTRLLSCRIPSNTAAADLPLLDPPRGRL